MHPNAAQRPGATDGPGPLTPLERAVLTAMLNGEAPGRAELRAQLAAATVASRTHSGVGFVTRLKVPQEFQGSAAAVLRPVLATHPQLAGEAEFLLELRDGRLGVLEAYCYMGGWPADEAEFRVLG